MAQIWAEQALTANGWENSVVVEISDNGRIARVEAERNPAGERHSILIPRRNERAQPCVSTRHGRARRIKALQGPRRFLGLAATDVQVP